MKYYQFHGATGVSVIMFCYIAFYIRNYTHSISKAPKGFISITCFCGLNDIVFINFHFYYQSRLFSNRC